MHRGRFQVERPAGERGAALLMVITLVLILAGVGAVVIVASRTEILIAAAFRQGRETLYAAEGAIALAIDGLARAPEWDAVLTGAADSSFTDGAAVGSRPLPAGGTVTLCCDAASLTGDVQQRAFGGRNWGADTPQWQIYVWGPAGDWLPAGRIDSPIYVAVWVADDPDETDGNPYADSNGVLLLHAQALGAAASRRMAEATVRRQILVGNGTPGPGVRVLSWQEIRW